jgi:lysophospholipase L1-like esterase
MNDSSLDRRSLSRRGFVAASTALAATAGEVAKVHAEPAAEPKQPLINPGATILFQGDSITDASRNRGEASQANSPAALGKGYAWLASSQLLVDRSEDDLKIFNRGISGNKVFQLADRWQADCLDLKPDMLSILIGVNDFWHKVNGQYDGTLEKYETGYKALLTRTKDDLPHVKLIICEPFVLRCGAVNDKWFPDFDGYRAAARRVAEQFNALFVPFQEMFDRASKIAPPERWAADGVHPSPDGAALMAHTWRTTLNEAG